MNDISGIDLKLNLPSIGNCEGEAPGALLKEAPVEDVPQAFFGVRSVSVCLGEDLRPSES